MIARGVLLVLLCSLIVPLAQAQQAPLTVMNPFPIAQSGDTIHVRVELGSEAAPVDELLGVGFELLFDDEALTFLDARPGALFTTAIENGTVQVVGPRVETRATTTFVAYSASILQGAAPPQTDVIRGAVVQLRFAVNTEAPIVEYTVALRNAVRSTTTQPSIAITSLVPGPVRLSTTRRARRVRLAAGDPSPLSFSVLDTLSIDVSALDADAVLTATRINEVLSGSSLPANEGDAYENATPGYWTIAQTGATSVQAEVCFPFALLTDALQDPAAVRVARRETATADWTLLTTDLRPDAQNPTSVCATTNTFSDFALVAPQSALPVELTAFEGTWEAGTVALTWTTASETNSAFFGVERRRPDGSFAALGVVEAAGTTANTTHYRFTDAALSLGSGTVIYRLRQVDLDGSATYSPEVAVQIALPSRVVLAPIAPHPVRGATALHLSVPTPQPVQVVIYDLLGRTVRVLTDGVQPAEHIALRFDPSDLPSGSYFVRVYTPTDVVSRRVVVLR